MKTSNTLKQINKHITLAVSLVLLALLGASSAQATDLYWDANGTTVGAGVTPNGTWGTDVFWSTNVLGTSTTANTPTTTADKLLFSAGSDTVGNYTVSLNGTQSAGSITARTGNLILSNGTLVMANTQVNGSTYLVTASNANLTIYSDLQVDNSPSGNNFFNFTPAGGTTITINGAVKATSNNLIYLRQGAGTGNIVFKSNLGSDANFRTGLAAGGMDGMNTGGSMTFEGNQTLTGTKISITATNKKGTINLGGTVDTNNAVSLAQIQVNNSAGMAGTTINVNSTVSLSNNATSVLIRNGAVLNVAGSLSAAGSTFLGINSSGDPVQGGAINILNGATASLATVQVAGGLTFKNGGTVTGTTLTLGNTGEGLSGRFQVGDSTGTGSATFTSLATAGTGTSNAIVGGNSANSTFTLSNSSAVNFAGAIGGGGANENHVLLVKAGTGTLTLSGTNTYTGSTTVNAGTLTLADNARLNFAIGASGVNNSVGGIGAAIFNGDFTFDLTSASFVVSGTWTIVDTNSLTASFGATFSVVGFNDIGGNNWEYVNGGDTYTFSETTGNLTAVPEPSSVAMLLLGAGGLWLMRCRAKARTWRC